MVEIDQLESIYTKRNKTKQMKLASSSRDTEIYENNIFIEQNPP